MSEGQIFHSGKPLSPDENPVASELFQQILDIQQRDAETDNTYIFSVPEQILAITRAIARLEDRVNTGTYDVKR